MHTLLGDLSRCRHHPAAMGSAAGKDIAEEDKRLNRNVLDQRRFIVVDGLYRNYGDLCPLPRLLELKAK